MEQHFIAFLGNHLLYFAGGAIMLGVLILNAKARKYFGKILTLALILLGLAVIYMIANQGEKQSVAPAFKAGAEQEKQRKSIYYKEPEEELRQSGAKPDRQPQ